MSPDKGIKNKMESPLNERPVVNYYFLLNVKFLNKTLQIEARKSGTLLICNFLMEARKSVRTLLIWNFQMKARNSVRSLLICNFLFTSVNASLTNVR